MALILYMYKEALVLIQQSLFRRLRHLHKLCQNIGRSHLYLHKQPFFPSELVSSSFLSLQSFDQSNSVGHLGHVSQVLSV